MMNITTDSIQGFEDYMYQNEKSGATILKYRQAVERFKAYLAGDVLTKSRIMEYREWLQGQWKAQTVNGALTAINAYLDYCGMSECRVKLLNVQKKAFLDESQELSETEYKRLLTAARERGSERLYLLMMTLGVTGIRVSEHPYITVEAARAGRAEIRLKGKSRIIIIQKDLCRKLLSYAEAQGITSGHIFRTKSGKPWDRSNICHAMKRLCDGARVNEHKVFPHNFRHLFARSFYGVEKNLAHLADVLGHSRLETTRIYVAVSARSHERILNKMRLIV